MSLQDDYFDLSAILKGKNKEALERIWGAFCDMESEQEELLEIKRSLKRLIELVFKNEC